MASSNAPSISNPPATLPVETTTPGANNQEERRVLLENNGSSTYLYRLSADIPEIPDIPSPLMRPPSGAQPKNASVVTSEASTNFPFSSAFVSSGGLVSQREADLPSEAENKRTPENLDSLIRNQVGRQVDRVFSDAVKDFQGHLISKANEVDQLRVELQSMELKEKEMFSGISQKSEIPVRTTFSNHQYPSTSTTFGGPLRTGGLGTKASSYTIPGIGNIGTELGLRESNAQIGDLKRKLKMTTELCAKQDAHYREVVSDLENRLKETVAGRDHVLALRENEAAGQLQLIHQLEAGLRKQQQIIEAKDEGLNSMQSQVKELEEDVASHKSFLDKIRRIALEEDKKRFRSGLVTSALESAVAVEQIGDALVELIRRCLFDDDNEKKTLQSTLDRVEAEFKSSRQLTENKQEELQKEYKARKAKLEDEHTQALELSTNRAAHVRKELETLQQETDKLKDEHQTVVSAMEDKVKSLELELEKTQKTSYETTVALEAKCRELECSVRDLKAGLQAAKDEQQSLYSRLSQEQANVITLNEKLSSIEKLRQEAEEKKESLSRELTNIKEKFNEEANALRDNLAEKERLIKQIHEETVRLRESEVKQAISVEKEKSNTRLDGILNELTKSNQTVSSLKEDLLAKEVELSKQRDESGKMKDDLELRTKEMNLIREEKINLTGELERRQNEISNLQQYVAELTSSLDTNTKDLEESQNCVEKLQTQLVEREKMLASFQAQGTNLAEILEKNSQTGDSLQREREQLVRTLEERISEVEEMKSHREILAKKLRSKDKRVKELEEEKCSMSNSLKIKQEELDALMDDRSNIMAELKLRQIEVTKLKDENSSLSSLVEGKHGEREKEITKLLSRLKGSEQDLALTRKLLKTKGDMSGKAVRVAESMQQEVTAKRGELDALQNKIHWLTESLNTASKDARYYERRSSELSEKVKQLTGDRDHLEFELRKIREQSDDQTKQLNHMEQALEKAALKHADSQSVIEKMEQEMARLKLKHSLEVKELERTSKALPIRADAASLIELLTKFNAGFRWPPLTTQANYSSVLMAPKNPATLLPPAQGMQSEVAELNTGQQAQTAQPRETSDASSRKSDEVTDDLKSLLHEVRTLISSFQAQVTSQIATPARTPGPTFTSQGPPERGPLDDGPVHPNGPVMEVKTQAPSHGNMAIGRGYSSATTENKKDDKEDVEKRHRNGAAKKRLRPRLGASSEHDRETDRDSVSSLATDLNSRVSSNYELDESDDVEGLALPLHSSSPKKDSITSSEAITEYSESRDRPHSPLSLSMNSDGSDVTSLLMDQSTSTADTVISRDLLNAPRSLKSRSNTSSASSGQWSSSNKSDAAPFKAKYSRPVPQNLKVRQQDGGVSSRAGSMRRNQEELLSRKLDASPARKISSENEPVYRRAEMILQSLAQTGEQLTKKNREIEHLLKEQDKRIKKCRKNEGNIHALLS